MMEGLRRDLGLAVRTLARTPGVTALAVITLALGIGANTAIFSAADTLLLRPLPYPHAARIYTIGTRSRQSGENDNISIGQYLLLRSRCQACAAVAALDAGAGSNLSGGAGRPLRVSSAAVTRGYFPLLGLPLVLGRNFSGAEQEPGAAGVVILSQSLWRQRFGGDAAILGRGVEVNGRAATIIGVAPDADGPGIGLWMPLDPHAAAVAAQGPNIETLVRLRPGVLPSQFQAELDLLSAAYHRIAPQAYPRKGRFWPTGYREDLTGSLAPEVMLLLIAVGLVLIIACVNVGSLLLARANARQQEMALRAALGAGRGRLLRQLLTESVLLAVIGAGLGLFLAAALLPLLRQFLAGASALSLGPAALPVAMKLDGTVLLFAFGLAVATGILFGLVPAVRATSGDLYGAIKQERGQSAGRKRRQASNTLVIVEMALACALLAGAGLVLVSFWRLAHRPVGFATGHVLTLETSLTGPRQKNPALAAGYVSSALGRARRLPGVVAAAATVGIPLVRGMNGGFRASGRHPQGYGQWLPVTPEFFSTLQLPIVAGRAFTAGDDAAGEPVCIVSADLARHFWPGENPIGQQITFATPRRVVGVAAAARMMGFGYGRQMYNVYIPLAQAQAALFALDDRWFPLAFLVRARGNPAAAGLEVERVIQAADPSQPLYALRTLDQIRGINLANFQWLTWLIAAFAGLALTLSAIGIYGVMAQAVGQRTREIGIRMALGAERGRIVRMILGQAVAVAAVGIVIGGIGAVAAAGWLRSQIPGTGHLNGWLLAATAGISLAAAVIAAWRPAWRAMRVDPLTALRQE